MKQAEIVSARWYKIMRLTLGDQRAVAENVQKIEHTVAVSVRAGEYEAKGDPDRVAVVIAGIASYGQAHHLEALFILRLAYFGCRRSLSTYGFLSESGSNGKRCQNCGTTVFVNLESARSDSHIIRNFDPPTFHFPITREVFTRRAHFIGDISAEKVLKLSWGMSLLLLKTEIVWSYKTLITIKEYRLV